MFADGCEIASKFTSPVIHSRRLFGGSVESGLGSFIVVNIDGWIVTCAHLLSTIIIQQENQKEIQEHEERIEMVTSDKKLNAKQRARQRKKIKPNPKWIINFAYMWGKTNSQIHDISLATDLDIAIGRLEPFDPILCDNSFPIFKDPEKDLRPGTSLCRLGFPFYEIKASYNEEKGQFDFDENPFPVPRFANEGIYSRNLIHGKSAFQDLPIKFIQTSSPGLRGQSGGPIFDIKGTIWAIQSSTAHLDLGFAPKKRGTGKVEHQFMNVGSGIHPEVIVSFFEHHNIEFNLSDY